MIVGDFVVSFTIPLHELTRAAFSAMPDQRITPIYFSHKSRRVAATLKRTALTEPEMGCWRGPHAPGHRERKQTGDRLPPDQAP